MVYHNALAEHTHIHKIIHTVGHFSMRLCDFPTHAIWAWQRMSGCLPAITHLKRENQQRPPETQRADWSQIGTRTPNQRDMLGYIVESERAYYSPGLTIQDSGHNERPPYLILFKKRPAKQKTYMTKSSTVQHTDTPHPPPLDLNNGATVEDQPAAKTA